MHSYKWGRLAILGACLAVFVGCGSGDSGKKGEGTGGQGGSTVGTGGGSSGGSGGAGGGSGGASTGGGPDAGTGGSSGGTDGGPDASTGGGGGTGGATEAGVPDAKTDGNDGASADGAVHCTTNSDCKDTNVCDGTTTCVNKVCVAGPPPTCTTTDPCKQAACDPTAGCFLRDLTGPTCNDNDPCTTTDTCNNGVCQGTGALSCDDANPCTNDSCATGSGCVHSPNTATCNDGNPCTLNDVCSGGSCTGTANTCDDGNPCTTDTCNSATGCSNTAVTDGTTCPADSNPCTLDSCVGGVCHTAVAAGSVSCRNASCTSGVATAAAFCDGTTTCPTAVTAPCGSGLCNGPACQGVCTQDSDCPTTSPYYCDTLTGSCVPKKSLGDTCAGNAQCANGQCVDGVCCATTCGGGNPNDCVKCQAGTGTCASLDGVACSDGNACTELDSCITGACIGIGVLCDDGNPCTADSCNPLSGCVAPPAPDGTLCNDNSACTTVDTCFGGVCNGTVPLVCDDGVYCDGQETCSPTLGCQPGTPVSCPDDGKSCTANFCDETLKACRTVAQDTLCSDGLFCDGLEKCDPTNPSSNATTGCVAGTPIVCNDSISCTTDTCSDSLKKCVYTPSNAACSDGNACNGAEVCDTLSGCKAGTPVDCNDGVYCTVDTCNTSTGACAHTNTDSLCNNGIYCDGAEVCNPSANPGASGCGAGTPVTCASTDAVPCTQDVCNSALTGQDACAVYYNNALCPSGQICTGSGCGSTTCTSDANCTDNNACNGIETCDLSGGSPGLCKAGTPPPPCNDGKSCTTDTCTPATGACVYTPVNTSCSDGNQCNGTETCSPSAGGADPTTGCAPGTPLVCNDGKSCTTDGCNPSTGCTVTPVDSACPDDGNVCNGIAQCAPFSSSADPTTGCITTAPITCPSDGVACTTDTCDPVKGCVHLPNNSACPCGQVCTSGGCGTVPVATCQGKVYQCGDGVDNDGDCGVDSYSDPDCLGPCQDNETGFHGNIPGQNNSPCKMDCYWDQDSGNGNDGCNWDLGCDPLSVAPNYYPKGTNKCPCIPTGITPTPYPDCNAGGGSTCQTWYQSQTTQCLNYCGVLAPNGCDCFGCCAIPGAVSSTNPNGTVYVGSEDSKGNGTCTLGVVNDPTKCHPCTQVASCLNPCDKCEICVGKPAPDPSCSVQSCPTGEELCGGTTGLTCPTGKFCLTGCCVAVPQ